MQKKYAIIVVDMLNDFITGALACDRSQRIIPPLAELLEAARKHGIPVIFSNDAHLPDIDKECVHWGAHAIAGTEGAQVIPELKQQAGDFVVPKRRYSGFFQTDMQMLLTELGVDTVIMTGMHTHMCVRHTTADAFQYGYDIIVPEDGVEAFTQADHDGGIAYFKSTYFAEITDCKTLIARWS